MRRGGGFCFNMQRHDNTSHTCLTTYQTALKRLRLIQITPFNPFLALPLVLTEPPPHQPPHPFIFNLQWNMMNDVR